MAENQTVETAETLEEVKTETVAVVEEISELQLYKDREKIGEVSGTSEVSSISWLPDADPEQCKVEVVSFDADSNKVVRQFKCSEQLYKDFEKAFVDGGKDAASVFLNKNFSKKTLVQ